MAYYQGGSQSSVVKEKMDIEEQALCLESPHTSTFRSSDCMAAVVGWREDPALFTRALESYQRTRGCVFLLVGIDGDEVEDRDMVDVFDMVGLSMVLQIIVLEFSLLTWIRYIRITLQLFTSQNLWVKLPKASELRRYPFVSSRELRLMKPK